MDRPPVRETARRYLVRGSNGAYEGKSLYDQIVDDLVEESKKRGFSHGLALTRRKEREPHFPVTREPENPSEQAGKREAAPPERWSTYPIPKPPGGFFLIPVDVRLPAERRRENNQGGYVDQAELVELILELDDDMRNNHPMPQGIVLQGVTLNWLSSPGSEWGGGGGPGGCRNPTNRIRHIRSRCPTASTSPLPKACWRFQGQNKVRV